MLRLEFLGNTVIYLPFSSTNKQKPHHKKYSRLLDLAECAGQFSLPAARRVPFLPAHNGTRCESINTTITSSSSRKPFDCFTGVYKDRQIVYFVPVYKAVLKMQVPSNVCSYAQGCVKDVCNYHQICVFYVHGCVKDASPIKYVRSYVHGWLC
jgi:hypothetical protein